MFGQPVRVQWQRPLDFLRQAGNGVGGGLGLLQPKACAIGQTDEHVCQGWATRNDVAHLVKRDVVALHRGHQIPRHVGHGGQLHVVKNSVRCGMGEPSRGSLKTRRPKPSCGSATGCAPIPRCTDQPRLWSARPCPVFWMLRLRCTTAAVPPSARLSQSVATAHAPLRETLHAWAHHFGEEWFAVPRRPFKNPTARVKAGIFFAAWLVQPRHECLFLLFFIWQPPGAIP